jgi:hypothetical protein
MNKIKFDAQFSSNVEIATLPPGIYFIGALDQVFKGETIKEILQYTHSENEHTLPANKFGLSCVSFLSGYLLFLGQCNGDIVIDETGFEYPQKNFLFLGCVPIELFKIDNIISLENAKEVGKIIKSSIPFVCKYEDGEFEINGLKISGNIFQCNKCKNIFHINDMTKVGDNLYCKDCSDYLSFCVACGCLIDYDNSMEVNNNFYCMDCYDELPCCYNCGEVFEDEDELIPVGGHLYCRRCYKALPFCNMCEEVFDDLNDLTLVGNHWYCDDCYDELPRCNKCKEVFEYEDDLIKYDGKLYCEDCYEEVLKDNKEEENENE